MTKIAPSVPSARSRPPFKTLNAIVIQWIEELEFLTGVSLKKQFVSKTPHVCYYIYKSKFLASVYEKPSQRMENRFSMKHYKAKLSCVFESEDNLKAYLRKITPTLIETINSLDEN